MGTIGPGWLSDVLGAAGVIDGAVTGIATEPMDVASAAGELARLSLTYENRHGHDTLAGRRHERIRPRAWPCRRICGRAVVAGTPVPGSVSRQALGLATKTGISRSVFCWYWA